MKVNIVVNVTPDKKTGVINKEGKIEEISNPETPKTETVTIDINTTEGFSELISNIFESVIDKSIDRASSYIPPISVQRPIY